MMRTVRYALRLFRYYSEPPTAATHKAWFADSVIDVIVRTCTFFRTYPCDAVGSVLQGV